MFLKLLLTIILSTQFFVSPNNIENVKTFAMVSIKEAGANLGGANSGRRVLGAQIQRQGDEVLIEGPRRIVNQNLDLVLSSKSALAVDVESGKILFEKDIDDIRPVASITKLMTVLVFLDEQVDFNKKMKINWQEQVEGGKIYVSTEEELTVENLFFSSLVSSANNATLALVRSTGLSKPEFVKKMNEKARELQMTRTYFEEPTGLSEKNVSSAADLVILVEQALSNQKILQALQMSEYKFKTDKKEHIIKNTDYLIKNKYFNITGGKTGFIDEAGYCLVTFGKVNGRELATVVLGAENSQARFQDTKALYWWTEQNYQW